MLGRRAAAALAVLLLGGCGGGGDGARVRTIDDATITFLNGSGTKICWRTADESDPECAALRLRPALDPPGRGQHAQLMLLKYEGLNGVGETVVIDVK